LNARTSLENGQPVTEASIKRRRTLVAEDNVVNQRVLTGILAKLRHEAIVVEDGEAAVAAVATESFDLVFMDCQMPGMDGYEAARQLRNLPTGSLPVIAVTANAMSTDKDKCLKAGMNDYLAKPVKLDQIRQMIHRWC